MTASDEGSGKGWIPGAVVVCRCEEILGEEIVAAIASGAETVNDVKRWTRAGMGACQGIYCMPYIAGMVAQTTTMAFDRIAPMTARAPVRPIRLDALAELAHDDRNDERAATEGEDSP